MGVEEIKGLFEQSRDQLKRDRDAKISEIKEEIQSTRNKALSKLR
ncbi:MAG TPA: hypothetical protein VH415_15455 [Nitrososphaeraceae archaeon]|jgi:hypothetical protein